MNEAFIKKALVGAAITLGTIWVLRRFSVTKNLVDRALVG